MVIYVYLVLNFYNYENKFSKNKFVYNYKYLEADERFLVLFT